MKKVKRLIAFLCVTAISMSLMSGCGKNNAKKGDDIELTFSFWEPGISKELENTINAIIADYEAEHKNVHIKTVVKAVSGYSQWISTQAAVDNLPDIESNHAGELDGQYNSGMIVDLAEDLNSPNPYNENKTWKDMFNEGTLLKTKYKYCIPYFGTGLSMFYNKTLYDKLGLSIPKTWDEFTANCEVIEKEGITPIAFMSQKNDAVDWLIWELTVGVAGKKLLSDPNINYNGDVYVSDQEVVKSIKTGYLDYTKNKELQDLYRDYLKYFKEYLRYSPNARGLDESAAKTLFMTGKAAHIETGSWDIEGLMLNKEMKFEVGTFPFPRFTSKNCKYGGLGMSVNSTQPLAVTKSVLKQEGKKEAAIDFLKYFTSPKVYSKFIEGAKQIPVMKDVDVSPVFKGFVSEGYSPMYFYKLGTEKGLKFSKIERKLIEGSDFNPTDADFAQIQESIEDWADSVMQNTKEITPENDYGLKDLTPGAQYTGEEYNN